MLIGLHGKEGRFGVRPARDLTDVGRETRVRVMDEITLQIQHDEESGWLVASWDAPMAPAASLRKRKTSATYSTRSPRR